MRTSNKHIPNKGKEIEMSIIERQTTLSKSLYEINTNTVKEWVSLQRGNVEQYIETNKDFGSRISEIKDVTSLVNLQREYGQTLWTNAKGAVEAQNEIVKDAFTHSRDAIKTAFIKD
ncbi:MAG: hypothetical protein ACJA2O_001792, partial [Candidatus Azotimanducaceae bacterium]